MAVRAADCGAATPRMRCRAAPPVRDHRPQHQIGAAAGDLDMMEQPLRRHPGIGVGVGDPGPRQARRPPRTAPPGSRCGGRRRPFRPSWAPRGRRGRRRVPPRSRRCTGPARRRPADHLGDRRSENGPGVGDRVQAPPIRRSSLRAGTTTTTRSIGAQPSSPSRAATDTAGGRTNTSSRKSASRCAARTAIPGRAAGVGARRRRRADTRGPDGASGRRPGPRRRPGTSTARSISRSRSSLPQ